MKLTGPIATLSLDGKLIVRAEDGSFDVPERRAREVMEAFGLRPFKPAPAPAPVEIPPVPVEVVIQALDAEKVQEILKESGPALVEAARSSRRRRR